MAIPASRVLLLLVVVVATFAQAHLKLYFEPYKLPIRSAPGPTSDGIFTAMTNQPCGGQRDWGRRGQNRYATNLVDGQRVCARANWNGGHTTTTFENKLHVVFICSRQGRAREFLDLPYLPLANGTNPPPELNENYVAAPLTNQIQEGYTVCVDLPEQNIPHDMPESNEDRQCTLAVVEGNGWGNCIDMMLLPKQRSASASDVNLIATSAFIAPVVDLAWVPEVRGPEVSILTKSEGTYRINSCMTDSGGKCCLTGYFAVLNTGAVSARFYGSSPQNLCFDLNYYGYRDYQMVLEPSTLSAGVFTTNFYLEMGYDTYLRPVSTQTMSLTLRDGGSMLIANVGVDIPEVADHDVIYHSSLDDGLYLANVPYPNYSTTPDVFPWWWIVIGVVGGTLVLYLLGGVYWNRKYGNGRCEHPHIHACLFNCGCVGKRKLNEDRYTLVLPSNWNSAVDTTSGEVYYFNTVTKETKWERPAGPFVGV